MEGNKVFYFEDMVGSIERAWIVVKCLEIDDSESTVLELGDCIHLFREQMIFLAPHLTSICHMRGEYSIIDGFELGLWNIVANFA